LLYSSRKRILRLIAQAAGSSRDDCFPAAVFSFAPFSSAYSMSAQYLRTQKITRDRVFYSLDVSRDDGAFFVNWHCLRCNKSWRTEHGEPSEEAAIKAATRDLETHHAFYHASN
jgi:hypothetical protein